MPINKYEHMNNIKYKRINSVVYARTHYIELGDPGGLITDKTLNVIESKRNKLRMEQGQWKLIIEVYFYYENARIVVCLRTIS